MTIEKLQRQGADSERVARLRELFPEVFSDGRVDLNRLREALEGEADEVPIGEEHYGLNWPGKHSARKQASKAPTASLRTALGEGIDESATRNLMIEGDNLEVLRLLQKSYSGRVNLIFIDPPYNTGSDFIYKDDFSDPVAVYLEATGQADFGGLLTSNPKSDGRFHSKWLSFMYPRLMLARNLLDNEGFLAVTIDDGEVHNLRLLLDSIFGGENFIANIVWQKAYVANMTAKFISATHDHVLVYAKNATESVVGRVPRTDEQIAKFSNPDNDPRGPWKAENLSAGKFYAAGQFSIKTPNGRTVTPPPGRYWRCNEQKYKDWLADGRITFGKDGDGRPMLKKFLSEVKDGLTAETWWRHEDSGSNKEASTELKRLFDGEQVFDTPKPVKLLKRIIGLFADKDALVLDFFAGSGTTGAAVMQLNHEDGGSRQFLLVQVPAITGRPTHRTIADITKARLKMTSQALVQTSPVEGSLGVEKPDRGFRVLKEDKTNVQRWVQFDGDSAAPLLDHIRTRSGLVPGYRRNDVLLEILLIEGYPLDSRCEQHPAFTDNLVTAVSHPSLPAQLLVCLDDTLTDDTVETLGTFEKDTLVCLDAALNDTLKVRIGDVIKRVRTL